MYCTCTVCAVLITSTRIIIVLVKEISGAGCGALNDLANVLCVRLQSCVLWVDLYSSLIILKTCGRHQIHEIIKCL